MSNGGRKSSSPFPGAFCHHHGIVAISSISFLLLVICTHAVPSHAGMVGVTFRAVDDSVDPEDVAEAVRKFGIRRVRLLDPSPSAVEAFADAGFELNLAIEVHETIYRIASSPPAAAAWFREMVLEVGARFKVTSISVGYNLLIRDPRRWDALLSAMENLREATRRSGNTTISTATSFYVIEGGLPPSSAAFKPELVGKMKRLLAVLNATGAPFQVDLFPYLILRSESSKALLKVPAAAGVDLNFAKMEPDAKKGGLLDAKTGFEYKNLFDVMVDAVITALGKAGYRDMPIEVVGTGWPSRVHGGYDPYAITLNAGHYNKRIVDHLNGRPGTPMRPHETPHTYIHSLFDGNVHDPSDENRIKDFMGIMNNYLELKYDIKFHAGTTAICGHWLTTLALVLQTWVALALL